MRLVSPAEALASAPLTPVIIQNEGVIPRNAAPHPRTAAGGHAGAAAAAGSGSGAGDW